MIRSLGLFLLIATLVLAGWSGNRVPTATADPSGVSVRPLICPESCTLVSWHYHCDVIPWNSCIFDNNPCVGCDKCVPSDCGQCYCG